MTTVDSTAAAESTGALLGTKGRAAGLAGLMPRRDGQAPAGSGTRAAEVVPPPPDPFAPAPLDRAAVTGSPEERLAIVERALRAAKLTEMESVRAARVRGRIEAGTALQFFVEDQLHLVAGYTSLDAYAAAVLQMDRSAVYEYIKDAKRLVLVAPVVKALERPLVPSQAKVLAPIVETHGEARARDVVTEALDTGKITVASLRAAAKKLGLNATDAEDEKDGPNGETPKAGQPDVLDVIEAALLRLREIRGALDKPAFRAAWLDVTETETETETAEGEDGERRARLAQLRAAVAAEARAILNAARWEPPKTG
ncbi:hypothetical protein [Streptomyces sp. NBC_01237]|uniref:hypothetical protein n=1 Tax=Streptomyces sp. NBC_01237 TaxID=2903790 RepID=UPI002DDAF916|nr:hypothetical protein [Streptomyces sp. NBC_01237]WRZ78735.1 hypothetical protein OG251_44730 [Streptomyces sp. NBC_01237]